MLVKRTDGCHWESEIVGQEYQRFACLWIFKSDATVGAGIYLKPCYFKKLVNQNDECQLRSFISLYDEWSQSEIECRQAALRRKGGIIIWLLVELMNG